MAARELLSLVERGMRLHPCPGYGKYPCGVNTYRELCFFCTKTRKLEREKR